MKLSSYLEATGESQEAFAKRATRCAPGERTVSQRTISRVVSGAVCNASTALAIIKASREQPTPDGGTVTLEDLAYTWADDDEASAA